MVKSTSEIKNEEKDVELSQTLKVTSYSMYK